VVGYQTAQSSNQSVIKERINQRELLFQTIVDIANNKEIQRIILKSQMSRGVFPTLDIPVVTKNQLKRMYFIGLILSKIINKLRIQSMIQQSQLINPEIQKEISTVIGKDATLRGEMTQLQNSECDCESNKTMSWNFPIFCGILAPVFFIMLILNALHQIFYFPLLLIHSVGLIFNCFWSSVPIT